MFRAFILRIKITKFIIPSLYLTDPKRLSNTLLESMLCVIHVATFIVWLLSHLCVKHRSGSFVTPNQWIMFDTYLPQLFLPDYVSNMNHRFSFHSDCSNISQANESSYYLFRFNQLLQCKTGTKVESTFWAIFA